MCRVFSNLKRNIPPKINEPETSKITEGTAAPIVATTADVEIAETTETTKKSEKSKKSEISETSEISKPLDVTETIKTPKTKTTKTTETQTTPPTTDEIVETVEKELPKIPEVIVDDKIIDFEKASLQDLISWLHGQAPLTEEQLKDLCINMNDFQKALKCVQPSSKREGFATVPDVTWDDVGSLQDIRQELQMSILVSDIVFEKYHFLNKIC